MNADALPFKRSHASADAASRQTKARRIADVLDGETGGLRRCDVLDIGTGSGDIASYVAARSKSVVSVDVVDERTKFDFAYHRVDSETLPFDAGSFDAVISNHVIEHVDDADRHLREIARMLRPGGICYLATPNRWALIEPHYKLPLLSWLPADRRSDYVRLARKGARYDVRPLSFVDLCTLAARNAFTVRDHSPAAAANAISERVRVRVPGIEVLRPLFPSFIVTLRRRL